MDFVATMLLASAVFKQASSQYIVDSCGPVSPTSCNAADKYRSLNGYCNNLQKPSWGVPFTPFIRLLPPRYGDGVESVPGSVVPGRALPGARAIALALYDELESPDARITLATMQFGQLIVHDMGLGGADFRAIDCCSPVNQNNSRCLNVPVPDDDPIYHPEECAFPLLRNINTHHCGQNPTSPAQQLNMVTSFLDASQVYGVSQELSNMLREFEGGRMRTVNINGKQYPPEWTAAPFRCPQGKKAFLTGDPRANQSPQLAVYQILLLREHNRLARELQLLNPHWDDERLFQESRRILVAELQHITYYEWLPLILGTNLVSARGLVYSSRDRKDTYVRDYNSSVDPSVINEHSGAAMRYFHTNVAGYLERMIESRDYSFSAIRLSDHINCPYVLQQDENLDRLSRGMHWQSMDASDDLYTEEITRYLFKKGPEEFGTDLRALDIQRGRDHGLASYNDFRVFCGLPRARRFRDFEDVIDREIVVDLMKTYVHPDDVDLMVGGTLESVRRGAQVGPTFSCILAEQFYRTRVGDRFFYENGHGPGRFSPEQLREIRKASISRLVCDNADNILRMQKRGFLRAKHRDLVPCSELSALKLHPWRENIEVEVKINFLRHIEEQEVKQSNEDILP